MSLENDSYTEDSVGKDIKTLSKADYIDKIKHNGKKVKKAKYRLTILVDYNLWTKAHPLLEGQFGELMEGAIAEYLDRVEKKSGWYPAPITFSSTTYKADYIATTPTANCGLQVF